MIEIFDNIWNFKSEYICVLTNGIVKKDGRLVMGSGQAKEALQRYPNIDLLLGDYINSFGNRCFILKYHGLISFPTKNHYKDLSSIDLIEKSCRELVEIADKFNIKSISIGRPGTGLGGLKWKNVKPILEKYLDDRFFVFHNE